MKVTVDLALLREASAPLRRAATVAQEIRSGTRGMRGHAEYAGDRQLQSAIEDFLDAWGQSARAVANHGETLARMTDLAASAYTESDQKAHRGHSGAIGRAT